MLAPALTRPSPEGVRGGRALPSAGLGRVRPHSQLPFLWSFLFHRTRVTSISGHSTDETGVRIPEKFFSSREALQRKQQEWGSEKHKRGGPGAPQEAKALGPHPSFYRGDVEAWAGWPPFSTAGGLVADLGRGPLPPGSQVLSPVPPRPPVWGPCQRATGAKRTESGSGNSR